MESTSSMNPFPLTGYHGADFFCDREEESAQLINNILNGRSTTLISIRRIGKTALIHHVFAQLPNNYKGVYLDIMGTENKAQFLNQMASAILTAIPRESGLGEKFWNFLRSLRPVLTFDPLSGIPQATFEIRPAEVEMNIISILQFLEQQEFTTVVAIDEFQQISVYPEAHTFEWLRSIIQSLKKVLFIFSGSQHHLMSELFQSPGRPFYGSTILMKLGKIRKETYNKYISSHFKNNGKEIQSDVVDDMLDWTRLHTFYVQLLANKVFSESQVVSESGIWKEVAWQLLREQETMFFAYRNLLTQPQWYLLQAIAKEGTVYQPSSKAFLNKHGLGTSATVLRSLKSLEKYDLIYYDYTESGEKYYCVYDILFQRWCEMR